MILVFTVAACGPPCPPADNCPDTSEESSAGQGMDGMAMPTRPCPLVYLTKNDPVPPPLYPAIGSAHWHVPWAQDYFDQGLRFYFAFNNRESYRAFREAAREAEDSGIPCSACYWAQALVLGVDLNMGTQSEDDREAANSALHRAIDANPNPEDWEIIRALFGRYQNCNPTKDKKEERKCQGIRNEAYYNGMETVLKEFGSDDPNVIALFADAAMNLTIWNYWDKQGNPVADYFAAITETKNQLVRALKFVQYPQNEGPIHWYIHLMEQSPTPDAAKRYADMLASLAPNAGHLVHMPSHIYFRMGDLRNAIRANKEAVDVDERYFAVEPNLYRPDGDRYRYGYYPHNIHFIIAAAALSGDDQEHDLTRYADKLLQSLPDKASGMRADEYTAAYYLTKVNFSSTADIRKFPQPDTDTKQPLANLAYDFTLLMAEIWDKNKANAKRLVDKLGADVASYRDKAPDDVKRGNPNCDLNRKLPKIEVCLAAVLDDLGHAQEAALNSNWAAAFDNADAARKIQDAVHKKQYEEPPMWPYPVRQTLASILIRWADADPTRRSTHLTDAKNALLESLNGPPGTPAGEIPTGTFPGNGWAYYGLLEIANRDGSVPADVAKAQADLDAHWFGDPGFHTLDRM
ncbi:hypothetical protein AWC00_19560 [Mycobacterium conspicuum]|nr:hypothetical protein AWC00_19560 [Mycobacterium conspicuum]